MIEEKENDGTIGNTSDNDKPEFDMIPKEKLMKMSEFISKVDNIIMMDDVREFKNLKMTEDEICNFVYQISGPKSLAQTERESRDRTSNTYTEYFQLNFNIIMLAVMYRSKKFMNYLLDEVVSKSMTPEKTKHRLLCMEDSIKLNKGGYQVVHLAAIMGDLEVLTILH